MPNPPKKYLKYHVFITNQTPKHMKNIGHSTLAMISLAILAPAAEPEAKPEAKSAAEVANGDV